MTLPAPTSLLAPNALFAIAIALLFLPVPGGITAQVQGGSFPEEVRTEKHNLTTFRFESLSSGPLSGAGLDLTGSGGEFEIANSALGITSGQSNPVLSFTNSMPDNLVVSLKLEGLSAGHNFYISLPNGCSIAFNRKNNTAAIYNPAQDGAPHSHPPVATVDKIWAVFNTGSPDDIVVASYRDKVKIWINDSLVLQAEKVQVQSTGKLKISSGWQSKLSITEIALAPVSEFAGSK